MQRFTPDRNLYYRNELKSWGINLLFFALVLFIVSWFQSRPISSYGVTIFLILVIFIADTFLRFLVREIMVDEQQGKLTIVLKSRFSGEKRHTYSLSSVRAKLVPARGLTKLLYSKLSLLIYPPPVGLFTLSSRFGYTTEDLKAIAEAIEKGRAAMTQPETARDFT